MPSKDKTLLFVTPAEIRRANKDKKYVFVTPNEIIGGELQVFVRKALVVRSKSTGLSVQYVGKTSIESVSLASIHNSVWDTQEKANKHIRTMCERDIFALQQRIEMLQRIAKQHE